MKKVFVSGCYDILHGGHIEFFKQARALGDYLIVCLPSDEVLLKYKNRNPWVPLEHKRSLISAIEHVDEVCVGAELSESMNFKKKFIECGANILAVTEDDQFISEKEEFCKK